MSPYFGQKKNMTEFLKFSALRLVLVNAFVLIPCLVDVIQHLRTRQLAQVTVRAGLIACAVFC